MTAVKRRLSVPLLTLGAVAVGAPAAAQAATVATDRPCYVEQQPMAISGTGFEAGSNVSVEAEQLFAFGTADNGGNFLFTTEKAPIVPTVTPDARTFKLTAKQDQQAVASTTFQVANFAFSVTPSRAKPTSTVRYRFSGFPRNSSVWVHVRRKGRTIGSARLGKAVGACGRLSTRARFMPVRRGRVPFGSYTYQFDTKRSYSGRSVPRLRGNVTISRSAG